MISTPPAVVTTLFGQHRDRAWRDRYGYIWSAHPVHEGGWQVKSPDSEAVRLGIPYPAYGPYEQVDA